MVLCAGATNNYKVVISNRPAAAAHADAAAAAAAASPGLCGDRDSNETGDHRQAHSAGVRFFFLRGRARVEI